MPLRFLAPLLLAGCASVPLSTLPYLNTLSPLDVPPADLRIEVTLPPGARIAESGSTLFLGAERADTGAELGRAFALQVTPVDATRSLVALPAQAAPAFEALQDQIAVWKAEAPEATRGTFSVAIAACRVGMGPAPEAVFSVVLPRTETRPALPLLVDAPVARALEAGALAEVCDGG